MKTSQLSVLKRVDNLLARASSRAAAAVVAGGNLSVTPNGGVLPGDLSGVTTSNILVAAMDLTPKASGLFRTTFLITYVLSAPDTVTWEVGLKPAVTAISGGATVNGNFHYETLGSPLVVTGGVPTASLASTVAVPAGALIQTVSIAGLVGLLISGRQAIELLAATAGGAHLTSLVVYGSAVEELL